MKKKMTVFLILGIILIVVGILFIAAYAFKKDVDNNILDGPGMIYEPDIRSASYTHGGSMNGEYCGITLYDGKITVTERENAGAEETTKTYDVGIRAYNAIQDIAEKYDLFARNGRYTATIDVCDAATTSVSLTDKGGNVCNFSTAFELPDDILAAIEEIKDAMLSETED